MSYDLDMLKIEDIAEKLNQPGVNVQAVARLAGVSAKTVYRIKWHAKKQAPEPLLETVQSIDAAIKTLKKRGAGVRDRLIKANGND